MSKEQESDRLWKAQMKKEPWYVRAIFYGIAGVIGLVVAWFFLGVVINSLWFHFGWFETIQEAFINVGRYGLRAGAFVAAALFAIGLVKILFEEVTRKIKASSKSTSFDGRQALNEKSGRFVRKTLMEKIVFFLEKLVPLMHLDTQRAWYFYGLVYTIFSAGAILASTPYSRIYYAPLIVSSFLPGFLFAVFAKFNDFEQPISKKVTLGFMWMGVLSIYALFSTSVEYLPETFLIFVLFPSVVLCGLHILQQTKSSS